jgi:hypothetical protein
MTITNKLTTKLSIKLLTTGPLPHIVAWGAMSNMTPSPLRIPPIYDILTGHRGVQSSLWCIREKNSGKIFGKKLKLFPHYIVMVYLLLKKIL